MRVLIDVSHLANLTFSANAINQAKGVADAILEPIMLYGIIIGVVLLCLMMPFLGYYMRGCTCRSCCMGCCPCMKSCFRTMGIDKFDDFDVTFLVHEANATSTSGKLNFCVRMSAGNHSVQTQYRNNSIFQETLILTVEQGTPEVRVELLDGGIMKRKIAVLTFDPLRDIVEQKSGCHEKVFAMKVKQKGIANPQIKLTYRIQKMDMESGPAAAARVDRTLDFLISEQLHKVGWTGKIEDPREMLLFLGKACGGPMDRFGTFGEKVTSYLGIRGPPKARRFAMGFWKDERQFEADKDPWEEIDILRITGVKPDPGRPEVFFIYYIDDNRVRQSVACRRVDRTREVWVKLLTMFISEVHAIKQKAHKARDDEKRAK